MIEIPASRSRCVVRGLLFAVMCLLATASRAMVLPKGDTHEQIESWGMDKGLPQASVTAVIQTHDDYIWVGTDGGLARFDGMKFTTFRSANTPSLTSHAITELLEDRAGNLWIGTERGLVRHAHGVFETVGLADRSILALSEDLEGNLWVGTDSGVAQFQGGRIQDLTVDSVPEGAAQAVLADSENRIWVGISGWAGVGYYRNGRFERVDTGGALSGEVLAMAEEPRGTLWFGTTNGLVQMKDGRFTHFGPETGLNGRRITELYADPMGGVWVANLGLQKIIRADLEMIDVVAPMTARSFHGLCRDREGNLWAGTTGEGLVRVRAAAFQLIGLNARVTANGFRTVMQDIAGVIWLAQGTLGYTRIASDTDVRRAMPGSGPENDRSEALAVYTSRNGDFWLGGRDALRLTRGGKSESFPELAGVRAIFEDSRGGIWLGRQKGGFVVWRNGVFTTPALPANVAHCSVSSFAETSTGDIWVGTWIDGALRLRGSEVTVFNHTTGLPTDELRLVYVDREDRVWIGTKGHGLAVQDGDRWLTPEWTSELLDQQILSILSDENDNLWFGAPRGVFAIPRKELLEVMRRKLPLNRVRIVNVVEGLQQGITDLACFPSAWRTREGHLWFATRRGILRIDPTQMRPNLRPPTVHIERVLVNGQRLPVSDEIVLSPETHGLGIEYTGLSFTAPGKVRFQYRLEGFEEDWVQAEDRRSAYYSNLRPGRYRFHVIASNGEGVWNDHGAVLSIVQRAHFYEEPWVLWTAGLTLAGGIFGAYRWRTSTHARERRRLETGITERTRELRIAKEQAEASTQAKAEFLESISHEIRNPLNGIIGLVAMLREAPLDARERELAHSLGACARGLARVFDEVLSFSKLEHGYVPVREKPFALGAMVEEVAALFRVTARQRGAAIIVRREGEVPDHWVGDAEKIKSILGNLVNNALKYAPRSPVEILVECDAGDEFGADVTFNVMDRGPGIPPDEQERIFEKFVRGSTAREPRTPGTGLGLATCRAFAELLGGHVAVESEPGRGSTFFLRLRLKRDRYPSTTDETVPEFALPAGRALIVEDQPYNQLVVQRIAERLGFVGDVAKDAHDALAQFGRRSYAVVFLDWELPDMRGDELVRCIRALPDGAAPIVIATTAHDSAEIRQRCRAAGMDGFALKPFELETISRLLDDCRSERGGLAGGEISQLDTRVFRFVGYDDPTQTGEAARLYLDILDQEVAMLESALDQQDPAATAAAAHRIKSHAGLVNAAELREVADRLQREARSAPATKLEGMREELVRHAGALREQLKAWRNAGVDG